MISPVTGGAVATVSVSAVAAGSLANVIAGTAQAHADGYISTAGQIVEPVFGGGLGKTDTVQNAVVVAQGFILDLFAGGGPARFDETPPMSGGSFGGASWYPDYPRHTKPKHAAVAVGGFIINPVCGTAIARVDYTARNKRRGQMKRAMEVWLIAA
jgi:hypothetical protein